MIGTINYKLKGATNKAKIYGVRRSLNSSSTLWERIEDSVGLTANAQQGTTTVQNDFDNIYPWSGIISCNYDTTNDEMSAIYGDDNFKFDGTNGQVMTIIPQFFYKRYRDDEYEYILISNKLLKGYTKSEQFLIGRYSNDVADNQFISATNKNQLTGKGIIDSRNLAQKLGNGWQILDWHYFIIQILYLVEYADYNVQEKLGYGYTDAVDLNIKSGQCDSLGNKSGSPVSIAEYNAQNSVSYRGIEDLFGVNNMLVDGINIKDCQVYINYNPSTYDSNSYSGDYKQLSYICPNTNGKTLAINKIGYDETNPLAMFPIEIGTVGGYQTPNENIPDCMLSKNGNYICTIGGNYVRTRSCGLWAYFFNLDSNSNYFRTRLIKV